MKSWCRSENANSRTLKSNKRKLDLSGVRIRAVDRILKSRIKSDLKSRIKSDLSDFFNS